MMRAAFVLIVTVASMTASASALAQYAERYSYPSGPGRYVPPPDFDYDEDDWQGRPRQGYLQPPRTVHRDRPPVEYRLDPQEETYAPRGAVRQARPYEAPANDPRSYEPPRRYDTAPQAPQPYDPQYRPAPPRDQARPAPGEIERREFRPPAEIGARSGGATIASLPADVQPETGEPRELAPRFRRQLVEYRTKEPAGTLIVDTQNTYLYLVLGKGQALRYGIGVGREGFTWAGAERVSRMAEWPDWHPPEEMIERQPYLPRFMAGGPGNPLGARALYLGKTLYRIHGTNQPSTIGTFVSSGCIRLLNEDIMDLYQRVQVGTRVVVLKGKAPASAERSR